jgi:predicted phage tail protein
MLDGFEAFLMQAKELGLVFAVYVGDRNIPQDELTHPVDGDISFIPVIAGAKNGGAIMTVLGAILVIVGIFLIWTPFGAPLIYAGIGLMVAGIAMMLAPQPKDPASEDEASKRASYAFNGPVNTQAQGNPVPILYGGHDTKGAFIGSAVISASIDVNEQVYVPREGVGYGGGSTVIHNVTQALMV